MTGGSSDHLHGATRALLWTVVVLAAAAGVELFVLSSRTDRYFAWTIQPPLTAAFLGAAYWSASCMALLPVRTRRWSTARPMIVGILAVTPLLLVVTLLHLGKFHLHSVYGIAWVVVYATLPVLTPVVIVVQRRGVRAARPEAPIPTALARLMVALVVGLGVVGVILLLWPGAARHVWPWPLATLASQAIGSWLVAYAVTLAWVVREGDLARARSAALAYAVFGLLGLGALARYPGSVPWSSPRTILLLVSLVAAVVGGLGVAALATARRTAADSADPSMAPAPA